MGRIDESKIIFPLFLIISLIFSVIPLLASVDVMFIDSYESFVMLLDAWYIDWFYFARIILANLDYMNFSWINLIGSFFSSLRFANFLIIVLLGYLWAAQKETYMKKRNRKWKSIILLYILGYISVALLLIFGFELTSIGNVISLFKSAGLILALSHFTIIVLCIMYLIIEYFDTYLGEVKR